MVGEVSAGILESTVSSELWQDKNKRGELETGEDEAAAEAAQCVSSTEAKLRAPSLK